MLRTIILMYALLWTASHPVFSQKPAEKMTVTLDSAALSADLLQIRKLERALMLARRNTDESNVNAMKVVHRMFSNAIRDELREYDQRRGLVPEDQQSKFSQRLAHLQEAFVAFDNFEYSPENHASWSKKTELMEIIYADMQSDFEMWKHHLGIPHVEAPTKTTTRRKPADTVSPAQHR